MTPALPDARQVVAYGLVQRGWNVRYVGQDINADREERRAVLLPSAKSDTVGKQRMTGLDVERIARARRRATEHRTAVVLVLFHAGVGWCCQSLAELDETPSDLVFDGRIRVWPLACFVPLGLEALDTARLVEEIETALVFG